MLLLIILEEVLIIIVAENFIFDASAFKNQRNSTKLYLFDKKLLHHTGINNLTVGVHTGILLKNMQKENRGYK